MTAYDAQSCVLHTSLPDGVPVKSLQLVAFESAAHAFAADALVCAAPLQ